MVRVPGWPIRYSETEPVDVTGTVATGELNPSPATRPSVEIFSEEDPNTAVVVSRVIRVPGSWVYPVVLTSKEGFGT
jgi:hypothetical protein